MSDLRLHCLVLGDTPDNIFLVTIARTATVAGLMEAVKDKYPPFHNIGAHQLKLYATSEEVANLDDDKLIQALKIPVEEGGHRKLVTRRPLSEVFMGVPPLTMLHILVQPPSDYKPPVAVPDLIVNCLIRGTEIGQTFSVHISSIKTVADLKKAIKSEMPVCEDAAAYELGLYNVSLPWDENRSEKLEGLKLDHAQLLKDPLQTLSDINFPPNHLHVVIEVPLSMRSRPPPEPSGRLLETKDIGLRRTHFLRKNPPVAPSSAGKARTFSMRQKEDSQVIYCNRPYTAEAMIPPTLLHPVFGQFLDDCDTLEITPEDNSLALRLHITMSGFCHNENERAKIVRDEFSNFGLHFVVSKIGNQFETDGDMHVKEHRYAITEIKNEVCSTGAEPYVQASLYYLESTRKFAGKMKRSSLPCMILLVVGSSISFAGAAWNVRPVVQTLSSALPMHYHPTDSDMRIKVARHLGAFRKAINALEQYYRDLPSDLTSYPSQSQLFPHCTSFTSLQNGLVQHFEYVSQPFSDHLIFFATLSNQPAEPVCIKFARRYSKYAHEESASLGHTPALHGFEQIPGGWLMIVMDKLPDEYVALYGSTPSSALVKNIRKHLQLLHQSGYVHGDVRNTNIMVSKFDKTKFMLVDFEWAGKDGEVRYPMNVNRGPNLWRPDDAVDGALILPEHDLDMLEVMTLNDSDMMEED